MRTRLRKVQLMRSSARSATSLFEYSVRRVCRRAQEASGMLTRPMRYAVVALFFVLIGAAVQPAWATLPTPNQPILVVQDGTSSDPYQNFIPELLTTEGLNGFQTAQLPDLTAAFL